MQQFSEVNIETEYLTYAGVNRSALILGVPMIPMVVILIFFFSAAMFAMPLLQNKAWAIVLLALPCLWFLREVTAKDDQSPAYFGLGTLLVVSTPQHETAWQHLCHLRHSIWKRTQ